MTGAPWSPDGRVGLALNRRALYAFDDFLIARYHMFVMVYFHHKSVVYEEMLKRYFTAPSCPYRIPSDIQAYLPVDDVHLWSHLRESQDEWAQALVGHRAWKRVLELHGTPASVDASWAIARLAENGIDVSAQMADAGQIEVAGVGMDTVLPVGIFPENVYLIVGAIVLSTMAAGVYPAWRASRVQPVEAIKLV